MKLRFVVSLAMLSILYLAQAQNPSPKADSLENALNNTVSPEGKVDLLNLLAYEVRTYDAEQSSRHVQEAISLAAEINYEYGKAYSNYVLGTLLMDKGEYDSALISLKLALEVMMKNGSEKDKENLHNNIGITYKRLGNLDSSSYHYSQEVGYVTDLYGKGRLFINIGSNYIAQGLLDSAAINQMKAVRIFEELNDAKGLTIAYLNLGNIHYKKEDYDWALSYYQKSLENAISSNHKPVQSRNYLNIGSIHSLREKHDSALYYFHRAVAIQEEMKDQTGLAATYRNLGETLLLIDQLDSAEYYFLKSNEIYKTTNHHEGKIRINKFLANLYLQQNRLKDAEYYINLAVGLAKTSGLIHELEKSLELQHKILVQQGKFDLAYGSLLAQKDLNDSLFKVEKVRQVNELQTQYETEKKDVEIASLSQQAQIQALEIGQRNTQLIGAGILLILILIGGYIFYQNRQLKHQQATADMEQRMLRLQMNPHFIFNALASIQSYILQNNTKESISYLAKFGKLMRQILEHSREEFITIAEEKEMLTNYLQIQQLRFQNRFDYQIEIDPALDQDEIKIPPLFAQPFVENAIEHGLKDKKEGGLVTIRFKSENDNIRLEVEDNGSGLVASDKGNKDHKSLATVISQDRLQILSKRFKFDFSLNVQPTTTGEGTLATIVLPSYS